MLSAPSTSSASSYVCAGCRWTAPAMEPQPFRCANAGVGDVDHLMTRELDSTLVRWPSGQEHNAFVRYRALSHSYHLALAGDLSDADFVALVEHLDKEVEAVDGHGFLVTPWGRADALCDLLGFAPGGGVWVKDETGNVSGSHKGRHLMGLAIHLQVVAQTGLLGTGGLQSRLAIASCGNAALAAAVVARAAGRPLDVFIPEWADPVVVSRLEGLGARLAICPRQEGVPGDPTYHRLQRAVREGSIPFTCQGPDNGMTIEGGETLGYEIISDLLQKGQRLDRLVVQVGGGALASSVVRAFHDAAALGVAVSLPPFHAVQTRGGFPLKRAYERVADRIVRRLEGKGIAAPRSMGDAERARFIRAHAREPEVEEELRYAAQHRSEFMWPWEQEPQSIAHGILDDETYDWLVVVEGMVRSGGFPVVVSEEELIESNEAARTTTGIDVDHTGSAGLAGLLDLKARGELGSQERVGVLFTGVRR